MKETIEKEARKFAQLCLLKSNHPYDFQSCEDGFIAGATKYTEELSKLNPNRIDEERMKEIWDNQPFSYNYWVSGMSEMIKRYNSTLPEPLPQKELPIVEELEKEIYRVMANYITDETKSYNVSKHIIDKYSLHSKKEEWWMGDIKDMKVKFITGEVKTLDGNLYARTGVGTFISVKELTPYTEPSIRERLIAKGVTKEEIEELVKEVGGE
jgi:hypothetical protein